MAEILDFDPWLRNSGDDAPPEGTRLVCRHQILEGAANFDEAVFAARRGGFIEFWVRIGDAEDPVSLGRAGRMQAETGEAEAARIFLAALLRTRGDHTFPKRLTEAGLVSAEDHAALLREVAAERERDREQEAIREDSSLLFDDGPLPDEFGPGTFIIMGRYAQALYEERYGRSSGEEKEED